MICEYTLKIFYTKYFSFISYKKKFIRGTILLQKYENCSIYAKWYCGTICLTRSSRTWIKAKASQQRSASTEKKQIDKKPRHKKRRTKKRKINVPRIRFWVPSAVTLSSATMTFVCFCSTLCHVFAEAAFPARRSRESLFEFSRVPAFRESWKATKSCTRTGSPCARWSRKGGLSIKSRIKVTSFSLSVSFNWLVMMGFWLCWIGRVVYEFLIWQLWVLSTFLFDVYVRMTFLRWSSY